MNKKNNFCKCINKKSILACSIALILVVAIISGICLLVSGTPKAVVKSHIKASYVTGNAKKQNAVNMMGSANYHKFCAEEANKDIKTYYREKTSYKATDYKEYIKYLTEETQNKLDSQYGKKRSIKFNSVKLTKYSEKELNNFRNLLGSQSYFKQKKISAIYKVKVDCTFSYNKVDDDMTFYYFVAKYKGKNKVVTFSSTDSFDYLVESNK